jgi:hypothetical protein
MHAQQWYMQRENAKFSSLTKMLGGKSIGASDLQMTDSGQYSQGTETRESASVRQSSCIEFIDPLSSLPRYLSVYIVFFFVKK